MADRSSIRFPDLASDPSDLRTATATEVITYVPSAGRLEWVPAEVMASPHVGRLLRLDAGPLGQLEVSEQTRVLTFDAQYSTYRLLSAARTEGCWLPLARHLGEPQEVQGPLDSSDFRWGSLIGLLALRGRHWKTSVQCPGNVAWDDWFLDVLVYPQLPRLYRHADPRQLQTLRRQIAETFDREPALVEAPQLDEVIRHAATNRVPGAVLASGSPSTIAGVMVGMMEAAGVCQYVGRGHANRDDFDQASKKSPAERTPRRYIEFGGLDAGQLEDLRFVCRRLAIRCQVQRGPVSSDGWKLILNTSDAIGFLLRATKLKKLLPRALLDWIAHIDADQHARSRAYDRTEVIPFSGAMERYSRFVVRQCSGDKLSKVFHYARKVGQVGRHTAQHITEQVLDSVIERALSEWGQLARRDDLVWARVVGIARWKRRVYAPRVHVDGGRYVVLGNGLIVAAEAAGADAPKAEAPGQKAKNAKPQSPDGRAAGLGRGPKRKIRVVRRAEAHP